MKKYIPIAIASFLFVLAILIFGKPILEVVTVDQKVLIAFIVILVTWLILSVVFFYLFTSGQKRRNKKLKERLKMWTDLSFYVNKAGDEVFNELPIGVLIYDSELEVKWSNPYALEIFDTKKIVDTDISELSKELATLIEDKKVRTIIEVNQEMYDVINRVDLGFIYLFNSTEREFIKSKYDNQLPALGIVYFDNLDESLNNLDMSEQSSLKGSYLAAVDDYLTKYNSYLKPYSEDRLIFLTYKDNLSQMMDNKFEILDTVRNISLKNDVRVTLSIGVASWDLNYGELGTYAQNAIDLAEKRGGDQVVVNIENQKIEYFGAKTDASAKSSKVTARVNAQTIRDYIKKASQVYIMGHNQTDLDSYGSMLAVYQMAKIDNKKVFKVYDEDRLDFTVTKIINQTKEVNSKHVIFENVLSSEEAIEKNDENTLLIIVDTQSPKIVISKELLEVSKNLLIIDHHRVSDDGFDSMFSYIEPYASSTIELVMELVSFYNEVVPFTSLEASLMYGGLVLDTNNFTIRTGVRTFEVAQRLRELEADPGLVKSWLRKDIKRTLAINNLMSKSEVYLDRFVFIVSDIPEDDRVLLAQTSDEALLVDGIDAAFTIAVINGVTSVSARSTANVNVQLIMEHIGGGGHLNSAAAQSKDKTVYQVYNEIKEYLDMEYSMEGEEMEVILLEDVKGRGKKDQVINVAAGYGNFLISSKKAIVASQDNLKVLNDSIQEEKDKMEQHLELMKKLKEEIESKSVTIEIQIGKEGKLFGSVTTKSIAEEFDNQNGILLDRKKIELPGEINSVGIYTATISLHKDVKANIEINVVEKQG